MKNRYKVMLLTIGILLAIALATGSSYALWIYTSVQEGVNAISSDCFDLTLEDSSIIKIDNAFPILDSQGVNEIPYNFTIKNVCNHASSYEINLEKLKSSTLGLENVKIDLNGHIKTYDELSSVEPISGEASSALKIYEGNLEERASKTFNLRLWIKDDAINSEIENKTFGSKITVKSVVKSKYSVATLKKGPDFNSEVKDMTGYTLNSSGEKVNNTITSITRSESAPSQEDNAIVVSDATSNVLVYAWTNADKTELYIYSSADKIFLNEDSSKLFYAFYSANTIDVSYFDTSKVTNMYWMFKGLTKINTLDVTNFDTSNVVNMEDLFSSNTLLTNLDLSNFNTAKVTNMRGMLYGVSKMTSVDVSHFNTSNVEIIRGMFENMGSLTTLDLSSFDTSKFSQCSLMFNSDINLNTIYVSNLWKLSSSVDSGSMFKNCSKIVGGQGTTYNTTIADKTYAHVDEGPINPGYFTLKLN